jgi:hypothetical protein
MLQRNITPERGTIISRYKPFPARATSFCLFLLLIGWGGTPAFADSLTGFYVVRWAGLPAAGIWMSLDDTQPVYRVQIGMESQGLPRWITHFRAEVSGDGAVGQQAAEPTHYEARYDLHKRKDSHIILRYGPDETGRIAERAEGDTSRKPQLAAIYRHNVVDPLAALVSIRQALRAGSHQPGQQFLVPVYDGARRFDVTATVTAQNPPDGLIHVHLTLHPIAGFKGETSEDGDPDSAPRPVDVTFKDDASLRPVSLSAPLAFFTMSVTLDHVCAEYQDCRAPS